MCDLYNLPRVNLVAGLIACFSPQTYQSPGNNTPNYFKTDLYKVVATDHLFRGPKKFVLIVFTSILKTVTLSICTRLC